MNTTKTGKGLSVLVFSLCVLVCTNLVAGRGGVHGRGGFHDNDYRPGGWQEHKAIHNDGINGAYVAVPEGGDYNQSCVTENNCNSYGQCWTQQNCD